MKISALVAQTIVRICAVVQLTTGLLFWSGNALQFVALHMLTGSLIVLGLWTLALLGWRAGVPLARVALALVWGVIVVALGMNQGQILEGDLHWLVQVLHLAVGLAALAQAEMLTMHIRRAPAAPEPAGLAGARTS